MRGASQGLGFQSMGRDLGIHVDIHIRTDATAAIGICRRRGLGKIRHLSCSDLWVQDRLRNQDFKLTKITGAEHSADLLIKHIERLTRMQLLPLMPLGEEQGETTSAPNLRH